MAYEVLIFYCERACVARIVELLRKRSNGVDGIAIPVHILDLRAPGSFLRTIDEKMMFGAYRGETNAPFLVFKVKNFEDALGGMLLFERNMNSDLAPLFGENLERIGQIGVYRDEVVGGVDTRSLYDQYGNMVITYAFIDKSTLVITTSYSALGALAQVLK